jgi:hypothetical protein
MVNRPGPRNQYDSIRPFVPGQRPDPPPELTDDEAVEWRKLTATVAPEWVTAENGPLFVLLVRHIVTARAVE